ncbi:hypothetical protein SCP_0501200 [Sparassis crispa]|uniref:Uncharacterized protein n=1 Tax=Sparassis crispa TaxID=139825 RepID=A0A401GMV1_9APHY|nr:hypothetical protein SCP_0501200 [Sparassis crispa]GBE83074.1 hypothetical protein SCP_0501200 [Sparassis crispa]
MSSMLPLTRRREDVLASLAVWLPRTASSPHLTALPYSPATASSYGPLHTPNPSNKHWSIFSPQSQFSDFSNTVTSTQSPSRSACRHQSHSWQRLQPPLRARSRIKLSLTGSPVSTTGTQSTVQHGTDAICYATFNEALIVLKDGLDLSNAFDVAVWALASIAFWCCCQYVHTSNSSPSDISRTSSHTHTHTVLHSLGELVIPSTNLFDQLKHVSRSVLPITFSRLTNGVDYTTFHIPWTKTTMQDGADISIIARAHPTCPLTTLRHHLSCNVDIIASAPLFAFETAAGGWSPMTKPWFMQRCNAVWVAAGFPDMPGHAFRIGGATELLLQGVNPART